MVRVTTHVLEAHILSEGDWIEATRICQLCRIDLSVMRELSELGLVTPREAAAAGRCRRPPCRACASSAG
jgi:hypothetical protein